jgi:hypothetical protein
MQPKRENHELRYEQILRERNPPLVGRGEGRELPAPEPTPSVAGRTTSQTGAATGQGPT